MIVRVDADGSIRLLEPADLRRFSVAMADADTARAALASVARLDGPDHAWIPPERIRGMAEGVPADWGTQFDAMVAYAAGKGWTDDAGALRAHIVLD